MRCGNPRVFNQPVGDVCLLLLLLLNVDGKPIWNTVHRDAVYCSEYCGENDRAGAPNQLRNKKRADTPVCVRCKFVYRRRYCDLLVVVSVGGRVLRQKYLSKK